MSGSAAQLDYLAALQERLGGTIRFDRWMQEALYHPEFGYYSAHIRSMGRGGDFTTWPQRHDSLARAIAAWAREAKPRGPWHLIEVGAGTGELAAAVLRACGWWNKPVLHIVEVSPRLRSLQQAKLKRRAIWHEEMAGALKAAGGEAVIYANELADAFPARIFQRQAAGWYELSLRIEQGKVIELWKISSDLPKSTVFDEQWPKGQRVEVLESYRKWLAGWSSAWRSGAMLTIDYGDTCPQLYHRRPHGTLRAYAHHQRLEGREALAGFGKRDLTVDVNFSDLQSPEAQVVSLGDFLKRYRQPAPHAMAEAAEAFQVLQEVRR